MHKKLIIGVVVVVALLGGVGLCLALLSQRGSSPPETPSQEAAATPASPANLTLTVQPSTTDLTASQSASFDLFLNTNNVNVDGFQFIATLNGASGPIVADSDPGTAGVQIEAATTDSLTVVTNSVITQNGDQVLRYAMITQNPATPFVSSSPVKVATVHFTTATAGALKLEFNTQNTRANRTGSTEETLISAASLNYNVIAALPTSAPVVEAAATPSAVLAKAAGTSVKATPAPSCNNACMADADCGTGLSCLNNACVNPSCTTSATCSCSSTPAPKAKATPKPTTTPVPQVAGITTDTTLASGSTALATAAPLVTQPVATIAALPKTLPKSGGVTDTIVLLTSGSLCLIVGAFFMLRWL